MEIIIGRQGNQKTPITDPSVSRKHCKVIVNPNGTFTVENLSGIGTRIDGHEIIRATATLDSVLQLGPTFSSKLSELIGIFPTSNQGSDRTYSLSHLREVWEKFNETNLRMADEQRRTNLTRTGLGIFTMCAMPTIFFFGPLGYVLTGIGVIGNLYSFIGMKNAETPAERQIRHEEFDDAWVCPNPECGRSLIAKNYKLLVRNYKSCPYCKCRYIE